MKIFYAGNNERGIKCFRKLLELPCEIIGALAVDPEEEQTGYYRSIREEVEKTRVEFFHHRDLSDEGTVEYIFNMLQPDLMIMVGYPKIIKKKFFSLFDLGCMNFHASPLPIGRGAAPLNWAIIEGRWKWGISIIDVDEGIDTGDLVMQKEVIISKDWTIKDLSDCVNDHYCDMMEELIHQISEGTVKRTAQDLIWTIPICYTKRRPEDGRIDWNCGSEEIYNLIRALTKPWPGAFSFYEGTKVNIWKSKRTEMLWREHFRGTSGRIIQRRGDGVIVICSQREALFIEDKERKFKVGKDFV